MQHVSDQPQHRSGGTFPGPSPPEQDLGSIWKAVTDRLQASVPESTFRLWLEPLRAAATQGNTLYISAPAGIRTWVERRYASLISEALRQVAATLREVSFAEPSPALMASPCDCASDAALNPSYTFERFVIGEGNRIGHAAALAVAEAPGEAYNPLFLPGPPGLGKTHLLVAIANYLRDAAPGLNVRYTTAECFTNEFVAALHASGSEQFKHRYRDLDVLLIDDVQVLGGKRHTEEEFFHTFNALYESGSQIVLSSDRVPSELSTLASRLRDRFEWGLTVPLESPNLSTRLTVLRRLVREAGIEIADPEALAELAGRIDANIRQLHGALTRVIAHASMRAKPVSADLIAEVFPARAKRSTPTTAERIREEVCATYGVSPEALIGRSRAATPLRARQVAIYLCRDLTDLSLPQIGEQFGGRDHTTVLNSIRRVERQASGDPQTQSTIDQLRVAIHAADR